MKKRFANTLNRLNIIYIACLFLMLFCVIIIKMFFIEFHTISGNSMLPTLSNGNKIFIQKNAYGYRLPRNVYEIPWVGNVAYYFSSNEYIDSILSLNKSFNYINSRVPNYNDIVALNIPGNNHYMAIKRCIAVPHDSIYNICDTTDMSTRAKLFKVVPYRGMILNASEINELQFKILLRNRDFHFDSSDSTFTALDDFIFVMGDNRDASEDSRVWGPIPVNLVAGKLITIL